MVFCSTQAAAAKSLSQISSQKFLDEKREQAAEAAEEAQKFLDEKRERAARKMAPTPSVSAAQAQGEVLHGAVVDAGHTAAQPRLGSMRTAMEAAARDLLYAVRGSRVADRMLTEWATRCRT